MIVAFRDVLLASAMSLQNAPATPPPAGPEVKTPAEATAQDTGPTLSEDAAQDARKALTPTPATNFLEASAETIAANKKLDKYIEFLMADKPKDANLELDKISASDRAKLKDLAVTAKEKLSADIKGNTANLDDRNLRLVRDTIQEVIDEVDKLSPAVSTPTATQDAAVATQPVQAKVPTTLEEVKNLESSLRSKLNITDANGPINFQAFSRVYNRESLADAFEVAVDLYKLIDAKAAAGQANALEKNLFKEMLKYQCVLTRTHRLSDMEALVANAAKGGLSTGNSPVASNSGAGQSAGASTTSPRDARADKKLDADISARDRAITEREKSGEVARNETSANGAVRRGVIIGREEDRSNQQAHNQQVEWFRRAGAEIFGRVFLGGVGRAGAKKVDDVLNGQKKK